MRWVDEDILHRHKSVYNLLQCMRWGNLNVDFLEDVIQKHDLVGSCKDSLYLVEFLKAFCKNHSLLPSTLPLPKKRDANGNYLISPEHAGKWLTPRYPRKLILVVGGWCGESPTKCAELYEPKRKKWRLINKVFPSLLQRPRAYHAILYLDGYIYLIGGYDGRSTYNSCDRFDMKTCQWKEMCGMHSRRCYVSATAANDCIFALGGADGSRDDRLKSAEKFYPSRNIWVRLPDMLERRSDAGACCLGSRVYVAGGFTGNECVFSVEFLDNDADQWTRISPMTVPRSGLSVVAYRGKLVVLGGYDGRERLKSVEIFDPSENRWATLSPMITKRSNFTSCVIDSKLVVMGGFNGIATCSDVEYYDDVCEQCGDASCSSYHLGNSSSCFISQLRTPPKHCGKMTEKSDAGTCSSKRALNFDNDLEMAGTSQISSSIKSQVSPGLVSPRKEIKGKSRWKSLPKMLLSRSALSSCVITGLSPKFLNSVLLEDQQDA
ncbi:unnamed protein product [Clavelina lepadiformis]|uniref:Uncharacterized protein n=1 Tax=Clavelina lepadiformis TaxID=159417 RepID=A0ABP0G3E4_CLALP